MSAGPLEGVRVLELCAYVSGPMTAGMLADQGADVIKVEAPGGDKFREAGTSRDGWAAMFLSLNRNKRSITLDLKQAEDRQALIDLLAHCDVFIQNARPGVVEKLGLHPAAICARYPRLIYASISGYGATGPNADEGALDPMVQAISGLAHLQRDLETGRPVLVRTWLADKLVAPMVAQAVSAALYQRERTGRGCAIDYVMLDALIWWLWPEAMMNQTFIGEGVKQDADTSAGSLIAQTADGYMVVSPHSDNGWNAFTKMAGRPDLITDPRFATRIARMGNLGAFAEVVRTSLGGRSTEEWCQLFKQADIPYAPILAGDQVLAHPQVVWNGSVREVLHPGAGAYRTPRAAIRFVGTPDMPVRPAPAAGEHTEEVLQQFGIRPAPVRARKQESD